MFSKAFEVKTEILGPDAEKGHKAEIRVLHRVLTWNSWGIGYEADPRHAEIVVRELGVEQGKAVTTPGSKDDNAKAHSENGEDFETLDPEGLYQQGDSTVRKKPKVSTVDGTELKGAEATLYRALCARLNYLA